MLVIQLDVVYIDSDDDKASLQLQDRPVFPLPNVDSDPTDSRSEQFPPANGNYDLSAPQSWLSGDRENSVLSFHTAEPDMDGFSPRLSPLHSATNDNGKQPEPVSSKENSIIYVDLSDEEDEIELNLANNSNLNADLASLAQSNAGTNGSTARPPQPVDISLPLLPEGLSQKEANETFNDLGDLDYESGSDDEIAVLSKEEAERTGTFKPTTFESNSLYNQPVPVVHAGGLTEAEYIQRREDAKIREHFERFSFPQIEQNELNLNNQLMQLDNQRDGFLRRVNDLRAQMLTLQFDQQSLKAEIMRTITESLREVEAVMKRSKSVRRFQGILRSVKEAKINPYGVRIAPQPGQINPVVVDNSQAYGTYVNPYMSRRPQAQNEDSVHLQKLLNDIYKEETVEGMATTPESLTVQLLDHQRKGLHWLLKKEESLAGSLLADDMGLGKTVQTIALMMANRSTDNACKTTLIVGPVSLLRQWAAELEAKINAENSLKIGFFHGPDRKKFSNFRAIARYDVILTSYTTLASEYKQHYANAIESAMVSQGQDVLPDEDAGGQTYQSPFYAPNAQFYRIVLDEAQYIKNKLSQASKAVALLKSKYRLCLTGTPMQNNIDELYPILRFLRLKPYDNERKFKRDISVPLKLSSDLSSDYNDDRQVSMRKLRAVLLAIMLRRTKDLEVDGKPLLQLPEKTVDQVYVAMDDEELIAYKELEAGIQKKAQKMLNLTSISNSFILTLLLRLRQSCIHEYLVIVGEMNAAEKKRGEANMGDWKQRYRVVTRMKGQAKQQIELNVEKTPQITNPDNDSSDEANEIQFTCPLCLDVVGQESIVIFGTCGHSICESCVLTFFEQYKLENSEYGENEASCNVCSERVKGTLLVDYDFYLKMVHEDYDYEDLEELYGIMRQKKTLNTEKIAKIIEEHGGFKESAKITKTLEIIQTVTNETADEKIIVFSHFTTTFDLMCHSLKNHNIPFLRYDGLMNIDNKNSVISDFYQGLRRVLLISLRAGNVGLTLTCASHVIIMDPFWNPFVEEQAMDRAHRFGQMKPVKVYKLLIHDSVEDRIMNIQTRKKELISSALDETALKQSSHLGRRELGYLFGLNSL